VNAHLPGPDPVLQGRVRLGVVAWLAGRGATAFTDLAAGLETANAVLSVQLRQLEEAGYVRLDRGFAGRRPRTTVALTATGRTAYERHLDRLLRLASGGSDA
jgi:DNA-binding MarR family transcriptional regulator